ncbi:MAG: T9SS type A sorting domain-containing protein [Bacteroidia bacterium]
MRRIVLHIATLLIVCATQAQILAPMGKGLPAAPDKIANHKDGVVAAYNDRDNIINLQIWNGDFWYTLPTPALPRTGTTPLGTYQIIDLISFENDIYLMTGYNQNLPVGAANSILKWDGSSWNNISDSKVTNSLSLKALLIEDNALKCIGKFKEGTVETNIARYTGSSWSLEGNLITNNIERDNFESVVKKGENIFATGTFTNPQDNKLSLVKWNGTEWTLTDFPPFLDKNIALGTYRDKIVVFGTSNFNTAPIKISQGTNWTDLDNGLENYTVQNISQFAELDGQLMALGSFVNNQTSQQSKLMLYDGEQWSPSNIVLNNIDQIHSFGKVVALSGDYDDNGILRGIGQIYADKAQVITRVFNDKNGNCKKDANEDWLRHYPVSINEVSLIPTGNNGVLYAQIEKNESYKINAANYRHFVPTCDDIQLEPTAYKTYFESALGARQVMGISDAQIYITDNQGNKYLSGEERAAVLCVSNLGSQPITDATISLQLPQGLGNFTSNVAPDGVTDNVATWTVSLSSSTDKCIALNYNLGGIDDQTLTAEVMLPNGVIDTDLTNNKSNFTYYTGESLSNNKQCLNGKNINPAEHQLRYKINVKNENAATVNAIKIVDILDEDIIRSVEGIYVTTSHSDATIYSDYEFVTNENGKQVLKLITTIEGVSIPGASDNDVLSKAFVDYQIGIRSDLMKKDAEICNTAKIYLSFENGVYGEPIATNTVCSYMSETLGVTNTIVSPPTIDDLGIGPNPVSDVVVISNDRSNSVHLSMVNSLGQKLKQLDVKQHSKISLDVSEYQPGVYFIYANGLFAKKIVIH